LAAVTVCSVFAVSPLAVSGGYGVHLQLLPYGTESPRATIDHWRGCEFDEDAPHPATAQPSATRAPTALATPRQCTQGP
jgi:hypothetical protein